MSPVMHSATSRTLIGLALTALLCLGVTERARADFNDGVLALVSGNYETALNTFMPLAETNDDGWSQYFLGRMYANGQGVEQDYEAAAQWYRKAAEKGLHDAQYRLGRLYAAGQGVPVDNEYAYGWYSVAAHQENPKAIEALERARMNLSAEQIVEANKLAEQLIADFGEPLQKHPSELSE